MTKQADDRRVEHVQKIDDIGMRQNHRSLTRMVSTRSAPKQTGSDARPAAACSD